MVSDSIPQKLFWMRVYSIVMQDSEPKALLTELLQGEGGWGRESWGGGVAVSSNPEMDATP